MHFRPQVQAAETTGTDTGTNQADAAPTGSMSISSTSSLRARVASISLDGWQLGSNNRESVCCHVTVLWQVACKRLCNPIHKWSKASNPVASCEFSCAQVHKLTQQLDVVLVLTSTLTRMLLTRRPILMASLRADTLTHTSTTLSSVGQYNHAASCTFYQLCSLSRARRLSKPILLLTSISKFRPKFRCAPPKFNFLWLAF
jgi:hypothetical protein